MATPMILFMTVVAPIWIVMHYRSVRRSTRSLNAEDRESIEHMLESVDKLTDRIGALESILDDEHPDWRQQPQRSQQTQRTEREGR